MDVEEDYREINRQAWNKRLESHLKSDFYDLAGFIKGKTSLNEIELNLLGEIKGKTILHLQCHFGQDTISLGRLGAKVTGVDLSDKAIDKAKELAEKLKVDADFICCDIYDIPNHLNRQFDIVFTSYGTISWLPDLDKWGKVIYQFLKPDGIFVFVEFHPVVWMFDDNFEKVEYNYFNSGPILETEKGTYADRNANILHKNINWNHSLGEVVNSLVKSGLEINSLNEFDFSPYNCFNRTIKTGQNKYRIEHLANRIPMIYAISASKKTTAKLKP